MFYRNYYLTNTGITREKEWKNEEKDQITKKKI